MKAKTRRAVVRDLGLMTLGSLVGPDLFAATTGELAAAPAFGLPTWVSKDSICVFLDGSWILRATDSNFMALTAYDPDNCYTQTIWETNPTWSKLAEGMYDVEVFREHGSCTCAADLLASQSDYLPYLRDVQCIFEATPSVPGSDPGSTLRVISLPTPDKLHTAACLGIDRKDYQGTDCVSGHKFKAPRYLATVVILEYKNASSLVVTQKATSPPGSVVVQKATPGQHYHLRTSLSSTMDGPTEERHIKCFTTQLATEMRHKADGSTVSFWIDPEELGSCKDVHIRKGVWNISDEELGMKPHDKNAPPGCHTKFILDSNGHGKDIPTFKDLANCAGGVLGGG